MLFKEFGDREKPVFILLHGGGLSWWSCEKIIAGLVSDYYVITPIIDGHGEDGSTDFCSIEDSAQKLADYIDTIWGGRVHVLAGLSIGAQIVVELLATRSNIAAKAVIESALVCPLPGTKLLAAPTYHLCYGLIKHSWFARLQAKALSLPPEMFEQYFNDSNKISKRSLINIALSNGTYSIKEGLTRCTTQALIIAGSREPAAVRKSARLLQAALPASKLLLLPGLKHGQFSLGQPELYLQRVREFLAN